MVKVPRRNRCLKEAIRLAKAGYPVFPVYGVKPTGECLCGNVNCHSPGKHPMLKGGFKIATLDEKTIKRWWKRHPHANIGVPTGEVSGTLVIDIDPRNGGARSLEKLEAEYGGFPPTVLAETGGCGAHLIYKYLRMK